MRLTSTGEITEGFHFLGHPSGPVFLLDGPDPVIFDAGFAALALLYEREIKTVLGSRAPAYLFLTHSHFDHIGAAGHLKSVWPRLKIGASARLPEILARPKAVRLIQTLSQEAAQALKSRAGVEVGEARFKPFGVDLVLSGGQTIPLGEGRTVQVLSTPGHTWDMLSYWVPEKRILVVSEAAGTDDGSGYIVSEFLVDYDAYRRSLEALARLEAEVLCLGHRLVLTGPEARVHLGRALDQAGRFLALVERLLREEEGDVERVVARVKAAEWDPRPWPKQPEQAYLLNTRARVRTIWARMNRGGPGFPPGNHGQDGRATSKLR